ncbi:MAG: sodium-dependent transporter [Gammaproteobacteria bacterium]|nr:MAG: sodium-dependent transporter [Gammaproteobacteria bacterium]
MLLYLCFDLLFCMALSTLQAPPQWRWRTTFVMALACAVVGVGNIWRFSYLAGNYGGGWFVLTYFACLLGIVAPILVAELALGSHGRGSPVQSFGRAARTSSCSRLWRLLGLLAVVSGVLVAVYCIVVASWGLAYIPKLSHGEFAAMSVVEVARRFELLLAAPGELMYWYCFMLIAVLGVLAMGVRRGIGLLAWILVPMLLVGLWVLAQYSLRHGELGRSVLAVAVFDTVVALLAGVAIYPLLFAHNLEPVQGPSLAFVALPFAFGNTPGGDVYGAFFYWVFVIAALGTAVALLEPAVFTVRRAFSVARVWAVLMVGTVVVCLGFAAVLSLNLWQTRRPFSGRQFFAYLEYVSADVLIPVCALLVTLFVGWRMRRETMRIELYRESRLFFSLWMVQLRYIVPLVIVLLFWLTEMK